MSPELDLIGFAELVWVQSFASFMVFGLGADLMARFSLIDDSPFDLRDWVWWIVAGTVLSVSAAVYVLYVPPSSFQ